MSTLFVPDTNTIISINLPDGSDDINFYISAPDWYQYAALGFGQSMADALMLVMYPSADHKGNDDPILLAKLSRLTQPTQA